MPFDRKLQFTILTLFHHFTIHHFTIAPLQNFWVISLCNFVVFRVVQSRVIMQEFGTVQYLMKYFTSWIFYVWKYFQYCTISTVTIVTQIIFIVSFFSLKNPCPSDNRRGGCTSANRCSSLRKMPIIDDDVVRIYPRVI